MKGGSLQESARRIAQVLLRPPAARLRSPSSPDRPCREGKLLRELQQEPHDKPFVIDVVTEIHLAPEEGTGGTGRPGLRVTVASLVHAPWRQSRGALLQIKPPLLPGVLAEQGQEGMYTGVPQRCQGLSSRTGACAAGVAGVLTALR